MTTCSFEFCRLYPHLFNESTFPLPEPKVDEWPLMSSPYPMLGLLAAYLYFVLSLGPRYMKTRKPLEIRNLMMAYNVSQVVYNGWMFGQLFMVDGAIWYIANHSCHPIQATYNPMNYTIISMAWHFLITKIADLLDTVFFVLRRKQTHVTFLHVYHHVIMVVAAWTFLKYVRGEQVVVIGVVNSFVHTCMYSYYFLSSLGPSVQPYLWWKPYITKLQLAQFVFLVTFWSSMMIRDCEIPRFFAVFIIFNAVIFLYLFSKFYFTTYKKKKEA